MSRIGIVVQRFPVPSETFIVNKVVGLADRGFKVTVFAVHKSNSWSRFETLSRRKDIEVILSVFQHVNNPLLLVVRSITLTLQKIARHPMVVIRMIRAIWSSRIERKSSFVQDFLYNLMYVGQTLDFLHVEFDAQAMRFASVNEWMGSKLVLSARGSISRTNILHEHPGFYRYIFKRVDHYHFISEYLLSESKKAGLPKDIAVSLIEPAIDLDAFHPVDRTAGSEIIKLITVARLSWAKGIEFGIDAVAIVAKQHPNIEYTIVGVGDYLEAIQFAASQHDLLSSGTVKLVGEVNKEEVVRLLQASDILIHPALEEGFCNAVIEAQAMELPVVSSDAGGLPENIEHTVTGYVVPRRDARAMAARIQELIEDPALRQRMGKEGRKRAMKKFNLNDQIDKFEKMYNSIT